MQTYFELYIDLDRHCGIAKKNSVREKGGLNSD